jgi:hypothetical protein
MRLEITNHFANNGKEFFYFDLYDGPDGIDHVSGFACDLVEAFSKIVEWRERIGQDYYTEALESLQNNETL